MNRIGLVGSRQEVLEEIGGGAIRGVIPEIINLERGDTLKKILSRNRHYFSLLTFDFITPQPMRLELIREIVNRFRCISLGILLFKFDAELWMKNELKYLMVPELGFPLKMEVFNLFLEVVLKRERIDIREKIIELSGLIDRGDPWCKGHSQEVKEIAFGIGRRLGLREDEMERLEVMAILHDISRIGFEDEIKDALDEIERGNDYLKTISNLDLPLFITNLERVEPGFGHYWEVFLEKGRRRRPLLEEIVALSDAYDFLTYSNHPDRIVENTGRILDNLKEIKGVNPDIVNALCRSVSEREFLKKEEEYKREHLGKFAAVLKGRITDVGDDMGELAMDVYQRYGEIPTYIGRIGKEIEIESEEDLR